MPKKLILILTILCCLFSCCLFVGDVKAAKGHQAQTRENNAEADAFFSDGNGKTGSKVKCMYHNTKIGKSSDMSVPVLTLECSYSAENKKVTCEKSITQSNRVKNSRKTFKIANLTATQQVVSKDKCPEAVYMNGSKLYFGTKSSGKSNVKSCCKSKSQDLQSGYFCGEKAESAKTTSVLKPSAATIAATNNWKITTTSCALYTHYKKIVSDDSIADDIVSDIEEDNAEDETKDAQKVQEQIENYKEKYQKDKEETEISRQVDITEGCGLLGTDATDMLRSALFIAFIAGGLLTVVFGLIDFIKAVTGVEDNGMKKAWQRFIRRIISMALLLLIPTLVAFVLTQVDFKGVNDDSIFCGIEK